MALVAAAGWTRGAPAPAAVAPRASSSPRRLGSRELPPLAHHRVRVDDPSSPPRPRRLLASPRRLARRTRYARAPPLAAYRLAPAGDGTTDHLPASARVPRGLSERRVRLPDRPGDAVVVGRESPPSDVVFPLGTVSAAHARFEADAETGELFVTDLGSVNGTSIDGRPCAPNVRYAVRERDEIVLGDEHLAKFVVEMAPADAVADSLDALASAARDAERSTRGARKVLEDGARGVRRFGDALSAIGGAMNNRGGVKPAGDNGGDRQMSAEGAAEDPFAEKIEISGDVRGQGEDGPLEPPTPPEGSADSDDPSTAVVVAVDPVEAADPVEGFSQNLDVISKLSSESRVLFAPAGWPGPAVELEPGVPVVLGAGLRRGDADVLVTAPGVDSAHARILRVGGAVFLEDLGSRRGTFVGGRQISPGLEYRLAPGADVRLGDAGCAFTLRVLEDDEDRLVSAEGDGAPLPNVTGTNGDGGGGFGGGFGGDGRAIGGSPGVGSFSPGGSDALVIPSAASRGGGSSGAVEILDGADVALTGVGDGTASAPSPWDLVGGLRGMGDSLGAAIFNSKINVNYSYKPNVVVSDGRGGTRSAELSDLKAAMLLALADTERGLRVTEERRRKIEQLARALEAKNPTRAPLKSPLMNGRWALQYTTAAEVIGKNRPGFLRPKGAIFQTVDIFAQKVRNEESVEPLPFVKFTNATVADLDAQTESRAGVRPTGGSVGGFRYDAPPETPARAARNLEMRASGAGSMAWMDTTFVDSEMRVSRSQSGDVFVFVRDDPNDEPNEER